ncbi:MAG: hypothetical protein KAI08_01255 [Bacteroidales bacterium]|nr:hypothetical protein [Bacteroidales bacterium]
MAGASYRWAGTVPRALGLGNLIVSTDAARITGFSFTPEVRYYFNFRYAVGIGFLF